MIAIQLLTAAVANLPLGFKPHVLFFLADDLGSYNIGYQGNTEVSTPTIDQLAFDGIKLDRHYVFKYCSPTRSSLLSGRLPYHVNMENKPVNEAGGVDIRMKTIADKLTSAGYISHQVGKWHAGSSCAANLPINRGFSSSFGYLGGEEDHYNQIDGGYVDLWSDNSPAYGKNGSTCDSSMCDVPTYNCYQYTRRSVEIIESHDPSVPLFLYHAWQEAHTPNEAPEKFLNKSIDYPLRQMYSGMVAALDSGIANVTSALKRRGMWNQSLIIFSSDNGGREDGDFGGNNYPLRGMKFTDFEGGVRVVAFISGGVIPLSKRGTRFDGLIHITDWYATACYLSNISASDSIAGLPNIDSINAWPALMDDNTSSQRTEICLSNDAIINYPWKLVLTSQQKKGWWTGPIHPNSTYEPRVDKDVGCPSDCLFNIKEDPGEHFNVKSENPAQYSELKKLLSEKLKTSFQTNSTPGYTSCIPLSKYAEHHHGFSGPVCTQNS